MSTFVHGQRVRVRDYLPWPHCGDPHFLVGHFGHIESSGGGFFDVRISRGPNGGKPDSRIYLDTEPDPDLWPLLANEIEAVD